MSDGAKRDSHRARFSTAATNPAFAAAKRPRRCAGGQPFAAGDIGVTQIDGVAVDEHLGWSPFSFPFNLTGLPALTIPTRSRAAGMPAGLQIVGPRYAEAMLLAVGAAYERATGAPSLIADEQYAR